MGSGRRRIERCGSGNVVRRIDILPSSSLKVGTTVNEKRHVLGLQFDLKTTPAVCLRYCSSLQIAGYISSDRVLGSTLSHRIEQVRITTVRSRYRLPPSRSSSSPNFPPRSPDLPPLHPVSRIIFLGSLGLILSLLLYHLREEPLHPFSDRESRGQPGRAHSDESDEVGKGWVRMDDLEIGIGSSGRGCVV